MNNNKMKEIKVEKVTLNIGTGKEQVMLEKGISLLQNISNMKPVKTISKKRIPAWGLRPGLPIGCKVTMRKAKAKEVIKSLIASKDNVLRDSNFSENGSISFGIHEYVDIPGIKYDPKIGIIGLEVCITLERAGYRNKKRRVKKSKIGKKHIISKEESVNFMKNQYNVKVGDA